MTAKPAVDVAGNMGLPDIQKNETTLGIGEEWKGWASNKVVIKVEGEFQWKNGTSNNLSLTNNQFHKHRRIT